MEMARGLSELLKTGWRPKRTIILALWDGEEWGLLGSTEWAEKHAAELRDKAAVYINTDSSGKGWLSAGGSHGLQQFLNEVAKDIPDPRSGKPIVEEARRRSVMNTPEAEPRRSAGRSRVPHRAARLGLGLHAVPAAPHDLASLNIGFGGESPGGIYHSVYDSVNWYTKYSDADFAYGRTLAQTTGTLALRLADAPVLPFQFSDTADTLARYVGELEKLAATKPDAKVDLTPRARGRRRAQARGAGLRTRLRRRSARVPEATLVGREGASRSQSAADHGRSAVSATARACRDATWFKHQIYAPGFYTGYGVKTMPQIREGLEEGRFTEAQGGTRTVAAAVRALAEQVEEAATALERAARR